MTKAIMTTKGQMTFLQFFNSTEIYSIKGFDSIRKAANFAKKNDITIFQNLPAEVTSFEYCN